jgi:hypothetical protein
MNTRIGIVFSLKIKDVWCHRQIVAGLTLQRYRLNSRPVHVGFVVENVAQK